MVATVIHLVLVMDFGCYLLATILAQGIDSQLAVPDSIPSCPTTQFLYSGVVVGLCCGLQSLGC